VIRIPVLVRVWVVPTGEARMSGAFTVTRTSILVVVKILVKTVKYFKFLAKVYSAMPIMLYIAVVVKIVIYLLCVV